MQGSFDREFVDRMARNAAKAFMESEVGLDDIVIAIAQEHDLNHEQIKRICEASNIKTKDKINEPLKNFELADAQSVIAFLQPSTKEDAEENIKEAAMRDGMSKETLSGAIQSAMADEETMIKFAKHFSPHASVLREKIARQRGSAVRKVYDGLKLALQKNAAEQARISGQTDDIATSIVGVLLKEGNAKGSINGSLSAMLKIAGDDQVAKIKIYAIYKMADNILESRWTRPVAALALEKTAGYPDPGARLPQLFKKYLELRKEAGVKKLVSEKLERRFREIVGKLAL